MKRLWTLIGLATLGVSSACMSQQPATAQETATVQAEIPGWLAKDFADLTALFDGRWDSERHGFFAEDAGLDPAILAPRAHFLITREDTGSDREARFVTTIEGEQVATHTLRIDAGTNTILQTSDGSDCTIIWRRQASQFVGTVPDSAACQASFPDPAGEGAFAATLAISDTEFWVTSSRGAARSERRLRRARMFSCWAQVLRGAKHGDTGKDNEDWQYYTDVRLHDQGGEAVIFTDETPPKKVRFILRDVEWTYGTNRASLVLYAHEGDNPRAASYAWTEANADRVGINLRWVQASCTHAPELR